MNGKGREIMHGLIDLSHLEVRPITEREQFQWSQLMREQHYLGYKGLVGESIRYVTILNEKWVGLLGFCSGTFTCAPRDQWIGWCTQQRLQRLKYISNNSRYLILKEVRIPNLASKALALALRRISDDWEEKYNHPLLMVETFVDQTLFRGSCYRAAGFINLGETSGFKRHNGKYYHHGKRISQMARPLSQDSLKQLTDAFLSPYMLKGTKTTPLLNLNRLNVKELVSYMGTVPDPRETRGVRYSFSTPLSIIVLSTLQGIKSFRQMSFMVETLPQRTLQELSCLRRRIYIAPENSAYRRSLMAVDKNAFLQVTAKWLEKEHQEHIIPEALHRLKELSQRQKGGDSDDS